MASSVERDDLVWVNNVPYNVKEFASRHPGGKTFVSLYGGRDATDAFATYHRRTFPHKSMQGYAVPKEVAAQHEPVASSSLSEDDPDFLNLCREVNEFLHKTGRGKGFAPPVYYLKVALILVAAVVLEVSVVREPNVFLAALLGFVFALIGLNIQHDANHGAVSQRPWINIVLGMTQDWIGGNSLLWLHQHTTIHHIECNDLDHDRDMMDNPVLRFSPLRSRWFFQSLQGFYFLALEAGYAAKVIIGDWYNLLLNMYEGVPISRTVPGWRWWSSVLARICWLVRLVAIPVYLHGWQAWLPSLLVLATVGGFYLAFFFLLSHNFEEVYHVMDHQLVPARDPLGEKSPQKDTLLRRQVLTSCNVGGAWLAQLNGGLNYQIEHHLFPRVHHGYYAAISPIVRAYCRRLNIQYIHFATVAENLASTSRFLSQQGVAPQVKPRAA